jgi:hypothetical protein
MFGQNLLSRYFLASFHVCDTDPAYILFNNKYRGMIDMRERSAFNVRRNIANEYSVIIIIIIIIIHLI